MKREALSRDDLMAFLSYDAESGIFTWKISPNRKICTGTAAGKNVYEGARYHTIKIKGRQYRAHRLAWLFIHGEWPRTHLDHIDLDTSNNRISNLRQATPTQNNANQRIRSNNKSGAKGVHWLPLKRRWKVGVTFNGKYRYIGIFKDVEDAREAYAVEAKKVFGEYARVA